MPSGKMEDDVAFHVQGLRGFRSRSRVQGHSIAFPDISGDKYPCGGL